MNAPAPQRMVVQPGSPVLKELCPVTRQSFQVGEEVVICPKCNTPYKADSWSFIGGQCMMCLGPQSAYAPPPPVAQRQMPPVEPVAPIPETAVPAKDKRRPEGALAWLIGPGGQLFAVNPGGDTSIGRAPDNDIVLKDANVSSHHARIRHGGGNAYYLYDLASTNGTYVNGTRIDRLVIYDGDELMFGRARLTYKQIYIQHSRGS